jgi:hypothetical protein
MAKAKAKKKAKANLKGLLGILAKEGGFGVSRELGGEKIPEDLRRLIKNWDSLPLHVQDGILILGRVRRISRVKKKGYVGTEAATQRQKKGAPPEWLPMALNLLKDSTGYLTDREISLRIGVHPSTLCRNEAYISAKRTYLQPFATIGRRGLSQKSST